MTDPKRARRTRRLPLLLLLLGAAPGCAGVGAGGAPAAPSLTPAERERVVHIMRVEDARIRGDSLLLASLDAPATAPLRARAALAAGRLRDPAARAALARLLLDPDTAVAATAAFSLGQLGDTSAVSALAAALSPDRARWSVQAEAAYALGKLRSASADSVLRALLATAAPAHAGEPIASALLATWRHPRPADIQPIVRWSGADDPELRWRAAYALVRRPTPAAVPVLQRLAGDRDARVRALAVRGLAAPLADSAGASDAVLPLVLSALSDEDYQVRINAARTLGSYPLPAAVQALAERLRADDTHLALAAAESLGRIGAAAAAAAGPLRAMAEDAGRPVFLRQTALESLARVDLAAGLQAARGLSTADAWRLRAAAARALSLGGSPARAEAEQLVRDADARVGAAALQALIEAAGSDPAPLTGLLLEALGAGDVVMRTAAIGALARLRDPAHFPLLLDAFERAAGDRENDAALAAVDAIAGFRGTALDPANAFFARFPRSPDHLVRLRVRERFGERADRWGDPLPVELRGAPHAQLLERADEEASPRVRIHTDEGVIELQLDLVNAPLTSENFLTLARDAYFDGQEWPRVVPNFVVQGGDPRGDTSGGPGYTIRDEINRLRYGSGTLGMALSGPDTGGSQWFITHSPQPHLDGIYTIFGRVVAGQEVTERILPGHRIQRVEVLP